jgi:outer membrane lipoprotein carrier protein
MLESGDVASHALALLEARYGGARTLEAKFLERYLENGQLVRAEAGNAYFLRPGRMRWDYEAPEKNTFLVDGKYVWFYSPADHTATRMPAKQSEDWRTPLAFLTSHMKLSRICARLGFAGDMRAESSGGLVFRCELREAPQGVAVKGTEQPRSRTGSNQDAASARAVFFEVSGEGELGRIVVPEEGGMQLEFSFTEWKWDPALDKTRFQFVPPQGVAIVEGLLPDTPGLRQ